MTRDESKELAEIKKLLSDVFGARKDPDNGSWKTARALFEQSTVSSLEKINEQLASMKCVTDQIPDIHVTVKENLAWRRRMNRVLSGLRPRKTGAAFS